MISLTEAWAICRRLDEAAEAALTRASVTASALEQPTITSAEAGQQTRRNRA